MSKKTVRMSMRLNLQKEAQSITDTSPPSISCVDVDETKEIEHERADVEKEELQQLKRKRADAEKEELPQLKRSRKNFEAASSRLLPLFLDMGPSIVLTTSVPRHVCQKRDSLLSKENVCIDDGDDALKETYVCLDINPDSKIVSCIDCDEEIFIEEGDIINIEF